MGTNLSGGAHFLGHGESPLEEVVQVHAQAARLVGLAGGLLQLAKICGSPSTMESRPLATRKT